ncbi:efflux RND transporter permease subunit, partial [Acinetobacter baumannii]
NIPFALFFSVIVLVLLGQDANLLSVGAVDFGIIVDSAVILVENIFRNFQASDKHKQETLGYLSEGQWGPDPTRPKPGSPNLWTDRLRL